MIGKLTRRAAAAALGLVLCVLSGAEPACARESGPAAGDDTPATVAAGAEVPGANLFPAGLLFTPLLADPRWPHFSASYHRYLDDEELKDVGAVSFGEYFSLYRNQTPGRGGWEVGLEAGVFSVFDLGASSQDLINADYRVGIPVAYRSGSFSALALLFHQSSHLGDEFLLRNRTERVNLSYEGIDLLFSREFASQWRVYGGGGYLIHRQPSELDPGRCRAGIEWRHDDPYLDRMVRPVAAFDARLHQESQWDADLSVRAGVQLENPLRRERHLQVLLEYFKGHSPNGQFYRRRIEYWGAGLHFYLP